jgi:hypothetical protein
MSSATQPATRTPSPSPVLLGLIALLAGCYGLIDPTAEPEFDPFVGGEPGQPVDEALVELEPDELFDAAGLEHGVPPDLLRAVGSVGSGFADLDGRQDASAPRWGWMALSADQADLGAALTDLRLSDVRSVPAANVLAAAALLDQLRPAGAEPTVVDSAWWPAVVEYAGLDEPWLADAFAAEVFATLQRGLIASTSQLEAGYVVIQPVPLSDLAGLEVEQPPTGGDGHGGPDYPSVARLLPSPNRTDRSAAIDRVVIHSVEASWAHGLAAALDPSSGVSSHYLVRPSDGEVTQLVRDGKAALHTSDDGNHHDSIAISVGGGSGSPGSWTPASLEATARLSAWLVMRHDIPVDREHFVGHDDLDDGSSHPGAFFPWAAFLDSVDCFVAGGGSECAGMAGGPEPDADFPDLGGDGARDVPDVPYFYQYANSLHPGSSCQNTSIAMVLRYAGWSGTPDTITARFGKDLAQSPAGLVEVFNTLASEAGLDARLVAHTSGSISGFKALLAEGNPVIVNGYFTGFGHVVVTLGYEGGQYVVNDPAGRWSQTFKGGYPYGWSSSAGKAIRYGAVAYEDAISLNSSGGGSLPLWFYELTGVSSTPSGSDSDSDGDGDGGDGSGSDGGGHSGGDGDGSGDGSPESIYSWASIGFTTPSHGDTVDNPVTMRSERHGGEHTEYWSGPWKLAPDDPYDPAWATAEFHTLGDRTLTAKNVSTWGTLLAQHTISVHVEEGSSLDVGATDLGYATWRFGATTEAPDVACVTYEADGLLLRDDDTGSECGSAGAHNLTHTFEYAGEYRIDATAWDSGGEVVARGHLALAVSSSTVAAECAVEGSISCGQTVGGDTSHGSDVIDGYPEIPGNWSGPEQGWTWVSTGGVVEIGFVDPDPTTLDLDIFILRQQEGVCVSPDAVGVAFNSVTFEAVAGATYVFVVDGYDGDAGAYGLELSCSP